MAIICGLILLPAVQAANRSLKTENVFLIISDGFRWQEVFSGADPILMNKTNGGVKNLSLLQTNFWRETPEARRSALLPFFWSEIAAHGQIYGNQNQGSIAKVTNDRRFSYPGYNEILTGFADAQINSNDKKPNPNRTVFEWLDQQPRFRKQVVAFGTWEAFPYIFNHERSGIPVWPPFEKRFVDNTIKAKPALLGLMADTTPVFEDVILDAYLFHAASDYIVQKQPRVVFVGFGETDEWAHAGRYDLYLDAAHNVDRFVQRLWESVQRIPQYRNRTTFIITADHGRGSGPSEWKDHGEKIPSSDGIWIAAIGPDTPALGERGQVAPVSQSQIAATLAALLGQDYVAFEKRAGAPIGELLALPRITP